MREVAIREDVIRLGQLLKLAGAVDSGAEAKLLLAEGGVRVNGEPEVRRGRQVHVGDVVHYADPAPDPAAPDGEWATFVVVAT